MYYESIDYNTGLPYIERASIIVRDQKSSYRAPCYNFNYEKYLTPKIMFEIAAWAEENFVGDWLIGYSCSGFELEEDYIKFVLRWV